MTLKSGWEAEPPGPPALLPLPIEALIYRAGHLTGEEIAALDRAEAIGAVHRHVAWDLLRDAYDTDPDLWASRLAARDRAWDAVNRSLARLDREPLPDDGYWHVTTRRGAGAARAARYAACALLDPRRLDDGVGELLLAPWREVIG